MDFLLGKHPSEVMTIEAVRGFFRGKTDIQVFSYAKKVIFPHCIQIRTHNVAFFNENKAGDLISRLNNDTDKLNQFVAQALMQFVGSVFLITGAAVFLVSLNLKLGLAALMPAIGVLLLTRLTSSWIKRKNLGSLQALGGMSSEVQESLKAKFDGVPVSKQNLSEWRQGGFREWQIRRELIGHSS